MNTGNEGLARRYARALLAVSGPQAAAYDEQLTQLANVLVEPAGRRFFFNPTVAADAKRHFAHAIWGESFPRLENFLAVVIEHGRETLIQEIASAYHRLVLEEQGFTEAVVETARELGENERQATREALDKFLGRATWPSFRVEPTLLGGVRVRYGDQMIDGSISGKLRRIKGRLMQANQSEVAK